MKELENHMDALSRIINAPYTKVGHPWIIYDVLFISSWLFES